MGFNSGFKGLIKQTYTFYLHNVLTCRIVFPVSTVVVSLNSTGQLLSVMEKAFFVLHDVNLKI